ncbi:hypothetical protein H0A36_15350 [Endozoicomonas sp. SM1973]|uniref:Uncharacterized protein n=1 Tax=Spartinivicinus marinus TaxID=2994442 RepID=A0A853I6U3_9GAMM|nr:hypothetical protein [Spartinivicinus marinus]MCX4026194.1 hypothetical protein [Spartinivicinus marinus]NYZ67392.1 hypothetical protein [Spartinivicinus marinus]
MGSTNVSVQLSNDKHQTLASDMSQVVEKLSSRALTNVKSSKLETVQNTLKSIQTTVDARLERNGGDNLLSIGEVAALSKQLTKVAKQFDNPQLKELTGLLADQLFADWLSQARTDIETNLYEQLKPIGDVGASKVKSLRVEVKGGGNVYGAKLKGSAGVEYQDILDADDEGLFFRTKVGTVGAGIHGGANFGAAKAGGGLNGAYSRLTFEEYNNVKSYVHMEAHNLTSLNRSDYELKQAAKTFSWRTIGRFISNHLPGHVGSELKLYQKQLQKVVNNQHKLNELLDKELGISAKVVATPPQQPETLRGYINKYAGSVDGAASVGIPSTNFSAAAGIKLAKEQTEIYEFVPSHFWRVIQTNADRINELPEPLVKYGKELLNQEGSGLDSYNKALGALHKLETEFNSYITTVQKYDAGDKSLRDEKHQIESRWGANGRHELLRAMHGAFALFGAELKKSSALEDELQQATAKMEQIAYQLESPPIEHSRQKLEDIASFKQLIRLSIADTKATFNVSAGPVAIETSILKRHRVHPSRMRQGDYIDLELKIEGTASVGNVTGLMDTITSKLANDYPGLVDPETFKGDVSNFLQNNADIAGTGALRMMVRFFKPEYQQSIKDMQPQYQQQFTRFLFSKSVSAGVGGSMPVAAGAEVGGKISVAHYDTRVLGEKVADNALSYVITRHNRYFRNKELNGDWQDFLKANNGAIKDLFCNIGASVGLAEEKQTPVFKEAQHWLTELATVAKNENGKKAALQLRDDFNSAMKQVFDHPDSQENFDLAKEKFCQFLSDQVAPWWENHQSNWITEQYKDGSSLADRLKTNLKSLGTTVVNQISHIGHVLQGRLINLKPANDSANRLFKQAVGMEFDNKPSRPNSQQLHLPSDIVWQHNPLYQQRVFH